MRPRRPPSGERVPAMGGAPEALVMRSSVSRAFALGLALAAFSAVDAAGGSAPFVQIQAAVNAASDGDVLLIKSGNDTAVQVVDTDVALAGDSGASVHVDAVRVSTQGLRRRRLGDDGGRVSRIGRRRAVGRARCSRVLARECAPARAPRPTFVAPDSETARRNAARRRGDADALRCAGGGRTVRRPNRAARASPACSASSVRMDRRTPPARTAGASSHPVRAPARATRT